MDYIRSTAECYGIKHTSVEPHAYSLQVYMHVHYQAPIMCFTCSDYCNRRIMKLDTVPFRRSEEIRTGFIKKNG